MEGERPQKQPALNVEEAFARLTALLQGRPREFAAVGGDVAFFVKGHKPSKWQVTSLGGAVVIRPGNPPFPRFTIGIVPQALSWMAQGKLDVPRAFKEKLMAVEGDLEALARFAACFEPDAE